MHVIHARNVNDAYRKGLELVAMVGEHAASRNGEVIRLADPVTTVYSEPTERVLFDVQRNANPFFHLFEALWMLNGQRDVATLHPFLPGFQQFSDDGEIFHGAYGYRWRHWPNYEENPPYILEHDQLQTAIDLLRKNPDDRRVVIGIWDPARDLASDSLDVPCNDLVKLRIVHGALDLHVYCRSNDAVWGCYGSNAVQFSILQEYLAGRIGVPVGKYWQISGDLHAYVDSPYQLQKFWPLIERDTVNPYAPRLRGESLSEFPLVTKADTFDRELRHFMRIVSSHNEQLDFFDCENGFFDLVALPMLRAHAQYRNGTIDEAIAVLKDAQQAISYPVDWLVAGALWLGRRKKDV